MHKSLGLAYFLTAANRTVKLIGRCGQRKEQIQPELSCFLTHNCMNIVSKAMRR
jgi:hypothetical protein